MFIETALHVIPLKMYRNMAMAPTLGSTQTPTGTTNFTDRLPRNDTTISPSGVVRKTSIILFQQAINIRELSIKIVLLILSSIISEVMLMQSYLTIYVLRWILPAFRRTVPT